MGTPSVAIAEDTDVSGSIATPDRYDLGPWLTDRAKLAQWGISADIQIPRRLRFVSRALMLVKRLTRAVFRTANAILSPLTWS
jgi:hypothetical protein